jgi:hypothetical protein
MQLCSSFPGQYAKEQNMNTPGKQEEKNIFTPLLPH